MSDTEGEIPVMVQNGKVYVPQELLAAVTAERDDLKQAVRVLSEQNDECHQPAANYELLLDKLKGVPTDHGNCPVAAHIDRLQALHEAELGMCEPHCDEVRRLKDRPVKRKA